METTDLLNDAVETLDRLIEQHQRALVEMKALRRKLAAQRVAHALSPPPAKRKGGAGADRGASGQAARRAKVAERVVSVGPVPPGLNNMQDAAEFVLARAPRPLHADEIAEALVAGGFVYVGEQSTLRSSIRSAMKRHPDRFVRHGRRLFSLKNEAPR